MKNLKNVKSFTVFFFFFFLVFLLNCLYLSHWLEKGKLWTEKIYKHLSIPRYTEKVENILRENGRAVRREREKARLVLLFNLLCLSHFAVKRKSMKRKYKECILKMLKNVKRGNCNQWTCQPIGKYDTKKPCYHKNLGSNMF